MSIISLEYLVFVCLFYFTFLILNKKYRKYLFLTFSYFFYGSISPILLGALIASTLVNFFGNSIFRRNRTHWIVALNILLLFVFKLEINISDETILVPMGISFFTFQAIGYVIDRSKNTIEGEQNLIDFANYLAFFPQLISGPIEKYNSLGVQLKNGGKTNFSNFQNGLFLILLGLAKKLIIADRCGAFVDSVFDNMEMSNATTISLATLLFYFQLFLDFSGFCNIAEGIAKLIGIQLSPNFRSPYLSTSIASFWRNWHISLHKWLKEYLYSGLKQKKGWIIAALITFLVSGIWHGLKFNFVLWGAFCFIALIFDHYIIQRIIKSKFIRLLSVSILMISAGIFYRINSMDDFSILLSKLKTWESISPLLSDLYYIATNPDNLKFSGDFTIGMQKINLSHLDLCILIFALLLWAMLTAYYKNKKPVLNLGIGVLCLAIMLIGFNSHKPFIYLQF